MSSAGILIVEDDPVLARGLADNFRDHGYRVEVASDGRLGLAAAIATSPDLILLDIMLPHLNGFELCRQLRQRKMEMPIVMLTAKGQEDDVVRGLELGADDYITKPFSIRELLARTKALLRRQASTPEPGYRIGDFHLDLVSHRLTRDGIEVSLTSKEFGLLAYFVSRPNRALTRRDILEHVWGRSIIVTERSIDRCVTTLRAKIESDPSGPRFIHTIRDVGYRFEWPSSP